MPTAEITVSNSCVVDLAVLSICAVTPTPGLRSSFLTAAFSRIFMPCLTKAFFAKARDFGVFHRQDAVHHLDHRGIGAQAC